MAERGLGSSLEAKELEGRSDGPFGEGVFLGGFGESFGVLVCQ